MFRLLGACLASTTFFGGRAERYLRPQDHDAIRAKVIHHINAKPGLPWQAGVNLRFKGLPRGASKTLCGKKSHPDGAPGRGTMPYTLQAGMLPSHFESQEKWPECRELIDNVRDQSGCGCCWAFAATGSAASRMCVATKGAVAVPLSPEELCFCSEDNGCLGGFPDLAWLYIHSRGVVTGGDYEGSGPFRNRGLCSSFSLPPCHHAANKSSKAVKDRCPDYSTVAPKCPAACDSGAKSPYSDFGRARYSFIGLVGFLSNNAHEIAQHMLTAGPVQAGMLVKEDFEDYVSGIYTETTKVVAGGHSVVLVGWGITDGLEYWRVQNSWSRDWGEKGYFRILRGTDESRIESEVITNAQDSVWVGPGLRPEDILAGNQTPRYRWGSSGSH